MGKNKILIDLDHPIWNSEPGFGGGSANKHTNMGRTDHPKCSLGKLCVAVNEYVDGYRTFERLLDPSGKVSEETREKLRTIHRLNDRCDVNGKNIPENHWAAISLMLEYLAGSGNVEFKGTFVKDIIASKEPANA